MEGGADFFGFGDPFCGDAEALADGEVIGKDSFWGVGIAEEGVASVTGEEAIFPLYDHSEVLVVNDDGFGGNIFGDSSGQFLDVHEEGAVAVDINDFAMGAGDFGAEGGGVTVAHGAETCGGKKTTGVVEVVELSCPHLVLTDARGDDGFSLGEAAELLNNLLGHDAIGDGGVGEGILFAPDLNSFTPFGEALGEVSVGPLGEKFIEVAQGEADIGEDGEVDDFIFVEFGGIDIDVDDGGFLGEFGNFTGDAVVEADAEGEEEITLIHGVVGVDGAVHPEPFEGLRIVFWEAADAHEGGGDGNSSGAGEFKEVGFGAGGDDASADIEHGTFGFLD